MLQDRAFQSVLSVTFGDVTTSRQNKRACSALDFRNVPLHTCSVHTPCILRDTSEDVGLMLAGVAILFAYQNRPFEYGYIMPSLCEVREKGMASPNDKKVSFARTGLLFSFSGHSVDEGRLGNAKKEMG